MKHFAALLTLLVATCAGSAQAQTRTLSDKGEMLDRVAAVVNEGVVLASELDEQMAAVMQRLKQAGQELPPQEMDGLIRSIGRIPRQRTTLYGEVAPAIREAGRSALPLAPIVLTPPNKRRAKEPVDV